MATAYQRQMLAERAERARLQQEQGQQQEQPQQELGMPEASSDWGHAAPAPVAADASTFQAPYAVGAQTDYGGSQQQEAWQYQGHAETLGGEMNYPQPDVSQWQLQAAQQQYHQQQGWYQHAPQPGLHHDPQHAPRPRGVEAYPGAPPPPPPPPPSSSAADGGAAPAPPPPPPPSAPAPVPEAEAAYPGHAAPGPAAAPGEGEAQQPQPQAQHAYQQSQEQPHEVEQNAFYNMTPEQQALYMQQWQEYYGQQQAAAAAQGYYGAAGGQEYWQHGHYYPDPHAQAAGQYGYAEAHHAASYAGGYAHMAHPQHHDPATYAHHMHGQQPQLPNMAVAAAAGYPHQPHHHHHPAQAQMPVRAGAAPVHIDAAGAAGFGAGGFDASGLLGDKTPGGGASGAGGAAGKRIPAWLREEMLKRAAAAAAGEASKSDRDKDADEEDDDAAPAAARRREDDSGTAGGGGGGGGRWRDLESRKEPRRAEPEADREEDARVREEIVNREIKSCLTKVLLEVTDALFEEVAREVYREAAGPKRPAVKADPAAAEATSGSDGNSSRKAADGPQRGGARREGRPQSDAGGKAAEARTAGVKREREPEGAEPSGKHGAPAAKAATVKADATKAGAVKLEVPIEALGLVRGGEDGDEEEEGGGGKGNGGGGGGGGALLGLAYGSDEDEE